MSKDNYPDKDNEDLEEGEYPESVESVEDLDTDPPPGGEGDDRVHETDEEAERVVSK